MRQSLALILAVLAAAPVTAAPRAEVVGHFDWVEQLDGFGGVSGIDLSADGLEFRIVTDTGMTLDGRFKRGADGAVTATVPGRWVLLLGEDPHPLAESVRDAEAISVQADGSFYVAFERNARVEWYQGPDTVAKLRDEGLDLSDQTFNRSFEALAEGPDGAVYVLPEVPPSWGGPYPVQVLRDGRWTMPFSIPSGETWMAVGADFGPDGRLYLLERDYWGLIGFKTRVRRITLSDETIAADDVLFETRAGDYGDFEGIAVWSAGPQDIRLTLVSDSNFLPGVSTEILDLRVSD